MTTGGIILITENIDESKKQPNRIFIDKELAIKVIMDQRTTTYELNLKQTTNRCHSNQIKLSGKKSLET